jgi:alpha-ketoglutarate-dependent taurine dioxygenase
VVLGTKRIALHGEMYYFPDKPQLLFLHCQRPSAVGGQTTVCQGSEFYKLLSPGLQKLFLKNRVTYVHRMTADELFSVYGLASPMEAVCNLKSRGFHSVVAVQDQKTVEFRHTTSAIVSTHNNPKKMFLNSVVNVLQMLDRPNKSQVIFESGEPIPMDVLEELESTGEAVSKLIEWESGDIVAIDNTTLMHGRRAFEGDRNIISRFGSSKPIALSHKIEGKNP